MYLQICTKQNTQDSEKKTQTHNRPNVQKIFFFVDNQTLGRKWDEMWENKQNKIDFLVELK